MNIPPILIIGIDSETERHPLENSRLNWSSPHSTTLEVASVIAILYDPMDVYDENKLSKLRKDYPMCNLTPSASERFNNVPFFKNITTLIYMGDETEIRGKARLWEENIITEYEEGVSFREKAIEVAKEVYGVSRPEKAEVLLKTIESELMKKRITRDIVKLVDRTRYSMLLAQNLNFDFNTMISMAELDKAGWKKGFYTTTDLGAGGYLDSVSLPFGDFLGLGAYGLLYKPVNGYTKTLYLTDLFGFSTYALIKDGHFVRLPKLHPGNLDKENYIANAERIIAYNLRDVEIMFDVIAQFPEIPLLSIAQIEYSYAIMKAMKGISLNINKEVFLARYRGDKEMAIEFTKRIKQRDPDYSFEKYLYDVFSGEL